MDDDAKLDRDREREPYARRMKLPILATGTLRTRTYVRLLSTEDATLLLGAWTTVFVGAKTQFRRGIAARHITTLLSFHPQLTPGVERRTLEAVRRTVLP